MPGFQQVGSDPVALTRHYQRSTSDKFLPLSLLARRTQGPKLAGYVVENQGIYSCGNQGRGLVLRWTPDHELAVRLVNPRYDALQ